jgi:lysophospholipase L1-like esterase
VKLPCSLLSCLLLINGARAEEKPPLIITLGDSITRGVRAGVKPDETFSSLLAAALKEKKIAAEVINSGIGNEASNQALRRLEKDVLARKPRIVVIMYGTNDSYVDKGKKDSRLSLDEFKRNIREIITTLKKNDIEPVLMTEPRWAPDTSDGIGENPNGRLEPYVAACRSLAAAEKIALVDHYAYWTEAEKKGVKLRDWTTDGYHPNPRGHKEMADLIVPVIIKTLQSQ